jgi:hypothetical protein
MSRTAKLRRRFQLPRKTAWLVLRLAECDKQEIREAAWRLNQTMSDYLRNLHRAAMRT